MKCPKCKSSIPDNVLRCPNCNLKVRIVCPKCSNISLMGKKFCADCGYEFFVKCPSCSTVNLSEADICRKCGNILKTKEPEINIEHEIIPQDNIINKIQEVKTENTSEVKTEVQNEVLDELTSEVQSISNIQHEEENNIASENIQENQIEYSDILSDEMSTRNLQESLTYTDNLDEEQNITYSDNLSEEIEENSFENVENQTTKDVQITEAKQIINEEPQKTDDDFMISSENIDISDEQIKDLFNKVEEIEKNKERKKEAEAIIQKKFEKNEEIVNENEEEIPPEYVQLNQQDAQTEIIEAIQNPMKRIISLNGKEGFGKTLIIKYVREALQKENYTWAWGECNALTQITPFGYLQDVLLNLFNLSNFNTDIDNFIKNNTKALEARYFNLNPKEVNDLLNFLYPTKTSEFNGILKRKDYTISIIKKVFETMALNSMVIFVIDDFESIDGASFDFLKIIIEDEKLREKIKILITNKYNKIAQGYFYNKDLNYNNYANIFLSGLDNEQCIKLINALYGEDISIPQNIKTSICENSKGTSAYIEQACLLLNEIGAIKQDESGKIVFNPEYEDYILPKNTYRILEERLGLLEKHNPLPVTALYYACLLGNKFSIHQFENVLQFLKISKDEFNQLCNFLISANYLIPMSENYLTFNNTLVWHYLYERAKTDENYVEFNKNIYMCVQPLTLSNNSLMPLLLQNSNNKKEAYLQWLKNAELSCYLGDTNLYVISLKQLIKIADEIPDLMSAQERIVIFERMGKILYKFNPKEAINYISAAIAYYKEQGNYNPVKIVELSGFLVQTCKKLGDYLGIIEACDEAVNALKEDSYTVEKAIITSKKLKALLYLGNCEEVITLARTELLETMENALAKANSSEILTDEMIFDSWVDTSLNLTCAYALQGNKKAFEIISKLDDAIIINKINNKDYILKIMITKALNHTMRGEIKLSADILTDIKAKYSADAMDEEFILKWNFINIINKIISMDYQDITDEMFQVATFANNIDDDYTKNMLKLLLGYVIQAKSKKSARALNIYNEEIVYFSKEKIATGALLCWLLIATASIQSKGVDFALDIALKALDVAKGPKVNNYIFIIALKQLIAKIYIMKRDFEAAKMYLEKAMNIAQQNDLKFMQMLLYQSFAKYFEEIPAANNEEETLFANKTAKMYKNAAVLSKELMLNEYEAITVKDYTAFKVSCNLKNISITEED